MEDYFRKRTTRRVGKDRTVSLNSCLYEAPVGLIGKIVTLLYHDHDPSRVEVLLDNTSHGYLVPLYVHINCRIRRHQNQTEILPKAKETQPAEPPKHYRNGLLFGKGDPDDKL